MEQQIADFNQIRDDHRRAADRYRVELNEAQKRHEGIQGNHDRYYLLWACVVEDLGKEDQLFMTKYHGTLHLYSH